MKERPILFSGPMVRAILAGRKTMTRRVMKPQPDYELVRPVVDRKTGEVHAYCDPEPTGLKCPYGVPGDRLWVRECWGPCEGGVCYRADEGPKVVPDDGRWHPSIHMPRWASRITLEVTDVRVERVQDITPAACASEGFDFVVTDGLMPRGQFAKLWDALNSKRGFGWEANPWVWVVDFRRTES